MLTRSPAHECSRHVSILLETGRCEVFQQGIDFVVEVLDGGSSPGSGKGVVTAVVRGLLSEGWRYRSTVTVHAKVPAEGEGTGFTGTAVLIVATGDLLELEDKWMVQ